MPTFRHLSEMRQDLVFGVRQLNRHRGFAVVAVLTLAIGIGATTAIFSAIQSVVLRALPYRQPERLVRVFESYREFNRAGMSRGNFVEIARRNAAFESMAAQQFEA
jgi:hypothetical protein